MNLPVIVETLFAAAISLEGHEERCAQELADGLDADGIFLGGDAQVKCCLWTLVVAFEGNVFLGGEGLIECCLRELAGVFKNDGVFLVEMDLPRAARRRVEREQSMVVFLVEICW